MLLYSFELELRQKGGAIFYILKGLFTKHHRFVRECIASFQILSRLRSLIVTLMIENKQF